MTAHAPEVSVILCTWNDFPEVKLCLQSLERQSLGADRFEVVLVTMGPLTTAPYNGELVLVTVPRGPRYNEAWMKNVGIRRSLAPVVAVMSSDCYAGPDLLAALLQRAVKPRHAALYYCNRRAVVEGEVQRLLMEESGTVAAEVFKAVRDQVGAWSQPYSFLAATRPDWDAFGGFDERYSYPCNFDADLHRRASLLGDTVNLDGSSWLAHLDHPAPPFDKSPGDTRILFEQGQKDSNTQANPGGWGLARPQWPQDWPRGWKGSYAEAPKEAP